MTKITVSFFLLYYYNILKNQHLELPPKSNFRHLKRTYVPIALLNMALKNNTIKFERDSRMFFFFKI